MESFKRAAWVRKSIIQAIPCAHLPLSQPLAIGQWICQPRASVIWQLKIKTWPWQKIRHTSIAEKVERRTEGRQMETSVSSSTSSEFSLLVTHPQNINCRYQRNTSSRTVHQQQICERFSLPSSTSFRHWSIASPNLYLFLPPTGKNNVDAFSEGCDSRKRDGYPRLMNFSGSWDLEDVVSYLLLWLKIGYFFLLQSRSYTFLVP